MLSYGMAFVTRKIMDGILVDSVDEPEDPHAIMKAYTSSFPVRLTPENVF